MQSDRRWSTRPARWPAILAFVLLPAGLCLGQQEPTPDPAAPGHEGAKVEVPGQWQAWLGELQPPGSPAHVTVVGAPVRLSEYWLGVVSEPMPEALRSQLNLREGEGLLIEDVAPNSPAAEAKIQRHDILLKAGGKTLARVDDLIAALDAAKGQKLPLEILRTGKPMTVEITPAKRPQGDISTLLPPAGPEPWEAMRKWLERVRPGEAQGRDFNFYYLRPGVVVARPGTPPDLPENVTISITRQGKKPTKITVTRGDQKWEVGESELDKLPADIRPHVEWMLRHNARGLFGPQMKSWLAPPASPTPSPPAAKPEARRENRPEARRPSEPPRPIEKQLDEMSRRLDELRKAMDELRQKQSNLPAVREAIPAPKLEAPKADAEKK